jgi:L-2-hydroxyglutarate oxidase
VRRVEGDGIRDVAIVGGGIVGLATAHALAHGRGLAVTLLEAEPRVASHQSGHNSGVVHSGLYYRPGSRRARLCVEGRLLLERLCAEEDLPYERCGKLVLATHRAELPRLDELERRGRANGLAGLRRLGPEALREREPHASGLAGLLVPETGITDYRAVCAALARRVEAAGGTLVMGAPVQAIREDGKEAVVTTGAGECRARLVVGCAGLHADRVARLGRVDPGIRIAPFRGEYWTLRPDRAQLVRQLIYPVPDPALPFLGVHFTRRVSGAVEAGPNAVLALARHGYARRDISLADVGDLLTWPGAWRLAARHGGRALAEAWRSSSRAATARALRRLVPELTAADLAPAPSGVRAQALGRDGTLLDDFHLVEGRRQVHVINAPSPAATACLAIGEWIAGVAVKRLQGGGPSDGIGGNSSAVR